MRILSLASALVLTPLVSGAPVVPGCSVLPDSVYRAERLAMGTTAEIWVVAEDYRRAAALQEAGFEEIERVEAVLSTYRATSEVSRINANASGGTVTVDPELFGLLSRALAYGESTGGAFDITVGSLVEAWGFAGGSGRRPDARALAGARSRTGWRHVLLDSSARAVRFAVPGLELDLGGIGKGWALDRAAEVLRGLGVESALLGLGGSSFLAIGSPPGRSGWAVTVPDPRVPGRPLSSVDLSDEALSTSGSAEKFFELNGVRYGHILDPRTGEPARGTTQATVIAPTATEADALSTAVYVLGAAASRMLIDERRNVSALIVTDAAETGPVVRLKWPGHAQR